MCYDCIITLSPNKHCKAEEDVFLCNKCNVWHRQVAYIHNQFSKAEYLHIKPSVVKDHIKTCLEIWFIWTKLIMNKVYSDLKRLAHRLWIYLKFWRVKFELANPKHHKKEKKKTTTKKTQFWPCRHRYKMHFLPPSLEQRQLFFNDLSLSWGVWELVNCRRQSHRDTENHSSK